LRRDVFLHFLNRDTREIFGVYDTLEEARHSTLMRRALNAAVILCEDRCVAPPGFIVEDQIAFELAENQRAYLIHGTIQFPMRESSLADFAEKKRIGYQPMRNRYSGLFDDTRIGFLGENATGIIGRQSRITERILHDWESGCDTGHKAWKPVKGLLVPAHLNSVIRIPGGLNEQGTALTWAAISPLLPPEAKAAAEELRNALQHIYFKQYCAEFKLVVISDIPHILRDFLLPSDQRVYSYRRLGAFLDAFELRNLLLDAPSNLIVALRKRSGFISFIDAYAGVARKAETLTTLQFYAARARDTVSYAWNTLEARRLSLFDTSPIEVSELADVLGEIAEKLVGEHGLPVRGQPLPAPKRFKEARPIMVSEPELVLFVALSEELDILTAKLGLTKNAEAPEASGKIGDVAVHVICPRSMGRVAAAVAMERYLSRRTRAPKLILIVGIAGGFEENGSTVGHIVAVTKVVDLALRKVVDEEQGPSPNFRREDYRMDEALSRVLQSTFNVRDWSAAACDLGWPQDRRPSIHYGPMASADEVVSSAKWRNMLIEGQGGEKKLLGVEMEAGGVCASATLHRVPVSMLRAISDQADPSKADDKWRALGMNTLADLLHNLPLKQVLQLV
jgi:nucleoside phosphorylase